jgi:F0F1-type ATP synthase delta subunit
MSLVRLYAESIVAGYGVEKSGVIYSEISQLSKFYNDISKLKRSDITDVISRLPFCKETTFVLNVLVSNSRFFLVPSISKYLEDLVCKKTGISKVKIQASSSAVLSRFIKQVEPKITGKKISILTSIDPRFSGVKVFSDGRLIDLTIDKSLSDIRDSVIKVINSRLI